MYYSDNAPMGEVCPYECEISLNWFKNKYKLYFWKRKTVAKIVDD